MPDFTFELLQRDVKTSTRRIREALKIRSENPPLNRGHYLTFFMKKQSFYELMSEFKRFHETLAGGCFFKQIYFQLFNDKLMFHDLYIKTLLSPKSATEPLRANLGNIC